MTTPTAVPITNPADGCRSATPTPVPTSIAIATNAPPALGPEDEEEEGGRLIAPLCHVPFADASVPRWGARHANGAMVNAHEPSCAAARADIAIVARDLCGWAGMDNTMYLPDRGTVTDAADLIHRFGDAAGLEATTRANRSRDIGNHVHFCRWRSIERLILVLGTDEATGTLH